MRWFTYDVEVFAHDWLVVVKDRDTGYKYIFRNDNESVRSLISDVEPNAIFCGFNTKHKSFENDDIKMTYIAATERKSIDSTKLKKEHPEIAEAYQKISQVKATVKIEIK